MPPAPPLDVLAVSCARYHILLSINVLLQLRLSLDTEIMVSCLSSDKTGMLPHLHGSFRRGSHLHPSSGSTSCSQGPNRSFSRDRNVFRDDSNEEDIVSLKPVVVWSGVFTLISMSQTRLSLWLTFPETTKWAEGNSAAWPFSLAAALTLVLMARLGTGSALPSVTGALTKILSVIENDFK